MQRFDYSNRYPLLNFIVNSHGNISIIGDNKSYQIRWLNINQFKNINKHNWENYTNQTTPSEIKQGFWTTNDLKNYTIEFWDNHNLLEQNGCFTHTNIIVWCGCSLGNFRQTCRICTLQIEYYEAKEYLDATEKYIINKLQLIDSAIYIQRLYRLNKSHH